MDRLVVNLDEFAELCGVTSETMRGYVKAVEGEPDWMIRRGTRGREYEIDAELGIAWWRKLRDDEAAIGAARAEQFAQLRLSLVGDAVEGEEAFSLSGKQRREEYAATMERIKLRRIMSELAEVSAIEAPLSALAVEHRRQLMLVPGEFAALTGMTPAEVAPLEGLLAKAIDTFWEKAVTVDAILRAGDA